MLEQNLLDLINRKQSTGEVQTSFNMRSVHSSQMKNEGQKDQELENLHRQVADLQDQLADQARENRTQSRAFNPMQDEKPPMMMQEPQRAHDTRSRPSNSRMDERTNAK